MKFDFCSCKHLGAWHILAWTLKLLTVAWSCELLFFPARWFAFIKNPKFVSNNYRECLLYRGSVWHIKDASPTGNPFIEIFVVDAYFIFEFLLKKNLYLNWFHRFFLFLNCPQILFIFLILLKEILWILIH